MGSGVPISLVALPLYLLHQLRDRASRRRRTAGRPKRGRHSTRFVPRNAFVQWQPDGLTIHTKKWLLGAGFLGAPPMSLKWCLVPSVRHALILGEGGQVSASRQKHKTVSQSTPSLYRRIRIAHVALLICMYTVGMHRLHTQSTYLGKYIASNDTACNVTNQRGKDNKQQSGEN